MEEKLNADRTVEVATEEQLVKVLERPLAIAHFVVRRDFGRLGNEERQMLGRQVETALNHDH